MRLAGVLAVSAVRMSFSRRMGARPSMKRRVRWSELVMMQLPTSSFSPGFSSTLSAISTSLRDSNVHDLVYPAIMAKTIEAGPGPPR
ncbi:hypothetical protein D3C72_2172660 [compost metagenome]